LECEDSSYQWLKKRSGELAYGEQIRVCALDPNRARPLNRQYFLEVPMKITRFLAAAAFVAACCAVVRAVPPFSGDFDNTNTTTAVFSGTSDDYVRSKLPDGSFQGETYGFGRGGFYGSASRDDTVESESFIDIARVIARPLAERNFIPSRDPKKVKLLIMVYWGATSGTLDPVSENFQYERAEHPKTPNRPFDLLGPITYQGGLVDLQNALILGYAGEIAATPTRLGIIHNVKRDDLIDDIEHNRYFVVLMAYDFQLLWKEKKHKLLWETRFSIREQGNDFVKMLPSMAQYASQYFGQDSHGLVRRPIPEGNVEIGVPRTVGQEGEKNGPLSDTTLIADAETFSPRSTGSRPDLSSLPAPLAARIASYESEKTALQGSLEAKIKAQGPGADARQAIDAFNTEHSAQIANLNRDAEAIRSDLANLAAAAPRPNPGQSVDALVQQFNEGVQEIQAGSPLFTHP
jgi:hypothetical protein